MTTSNTNSMSLIERLQSQLQPQGSAGLVQLRLSDSGLVSGDFIKQCIADLSKFPHRVAVGDTPNSLERLALMLLCDSAYIDLDEKVTYNQDTK